MEACARANARAGLVGNPSDGYFGKTISIIVRDFQATATCAAASRFVLAAPSGVAQTHDHVDAIARTAGSPGIDPGLRLLAATVKRFASHCLDLDVSTSPFVLRCETDIPARVGLAGSSAIVIAALRALARFHDVEIPGAVLASLALAVEVDELGIPAGLQDRVIQAFEGMVFMDFDRAIMERDACGRYERLDPDLLPPLFLAWNERLAQGTEVTHSDLRRRWESGDADVVDAMPRFAELARSARDLLVAGRGAEIGPLLDDNFDLRRSLCTLNPGHEDLVETGRGLGACVKFAGSGGAVIGTYDGDPDRLARLRDRYAETGARLIVPRVAGGGTP